MGIFREMKCSYFLQGTIGENTTKKPGAFNFVGQAKWNAWHALGSMSKVGRLVVNRWN